MVLPFLTESVILKNDLILYLYWIVLSKVLAENGGITSPECLKRAFIIEPVKPKAFPLCIFVQY